MGVVIFIASYVRFSICLGYRLVRNYCQKINFAKLVSELKIKVRYTLCLSLSCDDHVI